MTRAASPEGLKHVSATQLETFVDCGLKWYYSYPLGLKQPQTAAQGDGERIHSQMEQWYLDGTPPPKQAALNLTRDPRVPARSNDCILIEFPASYQLGLRLADVPVKGKIDLLDFATRRHPKVWDWKSCKTFGYIKSPDELERNIQLSIYGLWAFDTWPEATHVTYYHGYILKPELPKNAPSDAGYRIVETDPLEKQYVLDQKPHLETIVENMKVAAATKDPLEVPWDVSLGACGKFGGCHHREYCPRYQAANPQSIPYGGVPMSEKFAARKAAQSTAGATTTTGTTAPVRAFGINPSDAARPDLPPLPIPPTATATPTTEAVSSTAEKGVLQLYVDCFIQRGEHVWTRLEDEIAQRTPQVLRDLSIKERKPEIAHLSDVREAPFGTGTAALVASFKKDPPTGVVLATSAGLSGLVVDALLPHADLVVRGH